MSKASTKELENLHSVLAKTLADAIKSPGENGVSASVLNVARQFLKDNGIESLPAPGSDIEGLQQAMEDDFQAPFPGENTH